MQELPIFDFEKEFATSLRCIPMAVRFKLDQSGVKLSLRQWALLTHEDRKELLARPCRDSGDIQSYRLRMVELIAIRAQEAAKEVPVEACPAWEDTARIPAQLDEYIQTQNLTSPTVEQWGALIPLQRFALLKLIREGHHNLNFLPAMREFGVLKS